MTRPFTECYYDSDDGLRLYFRDYAGPANRDPVVCLPGLTRNSRDFEALAGWVSVERRVLCPDLRGRGESQYDPDWTNYNPAQYAADTWRLLDDLKIDRVAIVGTSLGGWLSMLMSHQQPGRVGAVVLNDIGPEANPEGIARVVAGAGNLDRVATFEQAVVQAVHRGFHVLPLRVLLERGHGGQQQDGGDGQRDQQFQDGERGGAVDASAMGVDVHGVIMKRCTGGNCRNRS